MVNHPSLFGLNDTKRKGIAMRKYKRESFFNIRNLFESFCEEDEVILEWGKPNV